MLTKLILLLKPGNKKTRMLGQEGRIIEILKVGEIGFALHTKYITGKKKILGLDVQYWKPII